MTYFLLGLGAWGVLEGIKAYSVGSGLSTALAYGGKRSDQPRLSLGYSARHVSGRSAAGPRLCASSMAARSDAVSRERVPASGR